MASIVSQTRQELRQSVGLELGAVAVSTTTSAGTTASFVDSELPNADKAQQGKHFVQTDGDNDGSIRIVDEYTGGTKTGRFRTAMGSAVASGVGYELWDPDVPPARVHDAMNRAIRAIPRKGFPPSTDLTLHSSRRMSQYDIPSAVKGIQRVEYRAFVNREEIENCDGAWSESSDSDVTVSLDSEDYRQGSGSLKLVVAGTVSNGDILASQVVGVDLTGMTHVEWWAKASTAAAAGDLALILSTTANGGTETEKLAFPALTADTWTRCVVALANPEDDGAIISVAVEYDANSVANDIWVDGIEATEEDSGTWEYVHRNYWRIDKGQNKLKFDVEGVRQIGHSRLALIGPKEPTMLNADTDVCDIDPEYIIQFAAAVLLRGRADRRSGNRDAAAVQADRLMAEAVRRAAQMPAPSGVRWTD